MFTRLAPEPSAETAPANSSVAPDETVAVTPAPIVAEPTVTLNRKVPALIFSALLPLRVGAPSSSRVPLPDLASTADGPLSAIVPAKVVLPDWATVNVVPPATLTRAVPPPATVPVRLATV